ncbi:hypothetical protein Acr_01g0012380 [Actinidia rufa]|uniref:Uncharacterized protein n=1 Tax=Actinidia rufa TaxID=165716 RepID=A0A7J0E648_9ERIC|nr:hypothetical protein Acr_01g0012380 [Actinidia rufa]
MDGPSHDCYLISSTEQRPVTGNHMSTTTLSVFNFLLSYSLTIDVVCGKSILDMTMLNLTASKSYNGGSIEGQGKFSLVPRTLVKKGTRLLANAEKAPMGPLGQRPSRLLQADGKGDRDEAIRRMSAEMKEMRFFISLWTLEESVPF